MDNQDTLEILKATIGTDVAAGLASAQDAAEFIDLTTDQTYVLNTLRVETGIVKDFNLDSLTLSDPVIVAGQEGTDPDAADVVAAGRSRATLTPKEVLAAFDVTYSWIKKNILNRIAGISREAAQIRALQALNNLFAKRFGKDVVMLAFMGNTALPADTRKNKALRVLDGFVKKAENDATVHDYVIPANPNYNSVVFPAMLTQLPKDYRDERESLAFFCSVDVLDAYAFEIGSRATAVGDRVLTRDGSLRTLHFHGVEIIPVFGMATERILLTVKENLAVGFGQQMMTESDRKPRARKVEVTITAEVDAQYAVGDAIVLGAAA